MMRVICTAVLAAALSGSARPAMAQHAGTEMGATFSADDMKALAAHMEMTTLRSSNRADSVRAAEIVAQLRSSVAKYRDVRVAIDDGFKQFAPKIKKQHVYHFTKYQWMLGNVFRFNPAKPTSLLYKKDAAGNFVLIGAMYTAPKGYSHDKLNKRVPLSIAKWHRHINWCLPPKGADWRWVEKRNGRPIFGPLGTISQAECDSAGGRFRKQFLNWMVHANVFASDDPKVIWGDAHGMAADVAIGHH